MPLIDIIQFPQMQRKVLMQLSAGISDGTFALNDTLGNELALAKRFGVSRNTAAFHHDDTGKLLIQWREGLEDYLLLHAVAEAGEKELAQRAAKEVIRNPEKLELWRHRLLEFLK